VYGKVNWGIILVVRVFCRSSSPASCSERGCLQSGVRWLRVLLSQAQKIPKDGGFTAPPGRQVQCLTILVMKLQEGVCSVFCGFWILILIGVSPILFLGKMQIN